MKTYVVTGATGHIGFRIAESLLQTGDRVKVIARSRERLLPLIEKGAEALIGNLAETEFLTEAFKGADAVFTMIPPDMQAKDVWASQTRVGTSIAEAIRRTGVKWVVNLSSQGAHLSRGTGPIAGLHEQEERLNRIPDVNVVHLRPAFFMENLLNNIGLIKEKGITGSPLRGDVKFPVIATRDIAHVAAEYLTKLNFTGSSVRDLLGQRDLSMIEMTELLGKAIGKPSLRYVQFSYEAAKEAMLGMGLSPDVARVMNEMYEAFNEGRILNGIERKTENTTETTFEEFSVEFARLYKTETPATLTEEPGKKVEVTELEETPHRSWWSQIHRRSKAA